MMSEIKLRWVVGLLTGHCHLKGHLFKLGLTDNPTCERCLQENESATRMEAVQSSEKLVNFYLTTTCPIPEENIVLQG
jgi:hypothetical protein